jgi:hypothetical protein
LTAQLPTSSAGSSGKPDADAVKPKPLALPQVSTPAPVAPSIPSDPVPLEPVLPPPLPTTAVRDENTNGSASSSRARGSSGTTAINAAEPASELAATTNVALTTSTVTSTQVAIQPGSSVQLALQQIADAQAVLAAQTWGNFNIAAGVVSLVPQAFLAGAQWSLAGWQGLTAPAQALVAATVGIPVAHNAAQFALGAAEFLPTVAVASMQAANFFTPIVGIFGASSAAFRHRT